jgi:hypothetical protein
VLGGCTSAPAPLLPAPAAAEAEAADAATPPSVGTAQIQQGFTATMVERMFGPPARIAARARGPALAAVWIYPNPAGGYTHIVFDRDRVAEIGHVR